MKNPKDIGNTVYACNSKSIEHLLRKFKKRVNNSKVIDEYKARQVFIKPSELKRIKNTKAKFNANIQNR